MGGGQRRWRRWIRRNDDDGHNDDYCHDDGWVQAATTDDDSYRDNNDRAPPTPSPLPDPVGSGSGPLGDRGSAGGDDCNRSSHDEVCSELPPSPTQLDDGSRNGVLQLMKSDGLEDFTPLLRGGFTTGSGLQDA
uniref:Uncharacterized protein n=1 Tax=Oryza punctata TaxID=4537 RepID=A0A0E0M6Z0_ORYPU